MLGSLSASKGTAGVIMRWRPVPSSRMMKIPCGEPKPYLGFYASRAIAITFATTTANGLLASNSCVQPALSSGSTVCS